MNAHHRPGLPTARDERSSYQSTGDQGPDSGSARGLKILREVPDSIDPRINDMALVGYLHQVRSGGGLEVTRRPR